MQVFQEDAGSRLLGFVVGHRLDPALFVGAIFPFLLDVRVDDARRLRLFLWRTKMHKPYRLALDL
jgi:hypothetical protein